MSDHVCPHSLVTPTPCDCYKKLDTYEIPLYVRDENEYYSEGQNPIVFEKAFSTPGILKINDEITEFLRVEHHTLSAVFEHMAHVFPALQDYEDNILSFWILDVLIEGLCTAQNAKMDFDHQKATLLWIAYFFNYIQKENPSRKKLFYHLKVLLFEESQKFGVDDEIAGETLHESTDSFPLIETHFNFPLPPLLYQGEDRSEAQSFKESSEKHKLELEGEETFASRNSENTKNNIRRNISDMKLILEILYRIFARINVYLHIQTVFNKMPPLEEITLPYELWTAKSIRKVVAPSQSKAQKGGKQLSVCEKYSEDEHLAEILLHKQDYILPLEVAEESREYLKYPSSERSLLRNKEEKNKK